MNSRERRDFEAGLASEVDAWLRGDTSRREFLTKFGMATGMLALSGPMATIMPGIARAAMMTELADPSSPLGKAQAAAVKASTETQDSSAYRAVAAAKQYAGKTLNMTYEAGLQALEPRNFSGPLWKDLTGIESSVIELPHPDQYSKPIAEHIANSGAYDILDLEPAWIPSLADGGVIAPIDDYMAKYLNKADLDDYHPLYKSLATYKGKYWGFFDDGDVFALYYRKDVFEDPKLKDAYQKKFNKPLEVPKTWDDYSQVAQFITDSMAPNVYGGAHFRKAGSPGNQFSFLQQFRANGGVFFDDATMKAQLGSAAGVTTLKQMVAQNAASMPGNNELDAVAVWAAWLQGKVAMIFSWPPSGRMTANYAQRDKAFSFIPQSTIAGKEGYAVVPGNPEHASGYVKSLTADSQNAEAAYLFMQWTTCPEVSLARTMTPYALRDPYRLSHYKSDLYRSLWPNAKDYLVNLSNSANVAVVDMIMPGWQDYALTIDRMCTAVWAGTAPEKALADASAEWDATTDRLGTDKQKAFYAEFKKLPGSYADHTIEKLGMAVKIE